MNEVLPIGDKPGYSLPLYDHAKQALIEAKSVDEVLKINDRATAIEAYAKQADDRQMEADAVEIRARAEHRLGEMMKAQKETVGLAKPGRPKKIGVSHTPISPPTLAQAGIDKNLAKRARKAAKRPVEEVVEERREKVLGRPHKTPTRKAPKGRSAKPGKTVRGHYGRKVPPIVSKLRKEAQGYVCPKCHMPPFEELKKALFPIIKELEKLGSPDHTVYFNPGGVLGQATKLRNFLAAWDKELPVPRAPTAEFQDHGAEGN